MIDRKLFYFYGRIFLGNGLSNIQPETATGEVNLFDFADDGLSTENRDESN
jgi:hypothetical protein